MHAQLTRAMPVDSQSWEETQLCHEMAEAFGGRLSSWSAAQFKTLFRAKMQKLSLSNAKQGPTRGNFFEGLGPCIAKHPCNQQLARSFFKEFKEELNLSISKHGNAIDGVVMCYDAIFASDLSLSADTEVQENLTNVKRGQTTMAT
eukprot:3048155-Prymnesium_polylepis.1